MQIDEGKGIWKPVPQYNPSTGNYSTNYADFTEKCFRGPTTEYSERAGKMAPARINAIVNTAKEYRRSAPNDLAVVSEVEVRGRNELADDDGDK